MIYKCRSGSECTLTFTTERGLHIHRQACDHYKRHEAAAQPAAPPSAPEPAAAEPVSGAASEANRIDALTKLKSLLDSGVLTQEQYDSEHARLTEGM